ncbi:uncharacterized protein LOC127249354 [Andrographis paniculata]|uniref:uncharacterized protein LOC127249354 n=1 Tax=Andrographis paniculata TaxID=175694 RepID=UPI0021E752F6|nr:uncharacterized protein LOC127249354 [Andrographis paniculata]
MDSVHINRNAASSENVHVKKLLPPGSGNSGAEIEVSEIMSIPSDVIDEFGEPEILPRVGDEYQAELPPLFQEFYDMPNKKKRAAENFVVGMPVFLTWVGNGKPDAPATCGSSTTSDSTQITTKNEIFCSEIDHTRDSTSQNFSGGPGLRLVPGFDEKDWTAIEKDSFLLGLYIFEKNFVEVRRFVGTKEMGSLLSFYYGKFYGSQEYQRWTQCRKMKNRRCIFGQRIFTGLRQQELLSRIVPKVSEECRNAVLEVSKTFVEEKTSLSDYVSSLKAMVGMATLIEAIGIGTGKHDLTGMALESSKSNHAIAARPEIPTGKDCSSLTTTDIVKFLSGNYRLSKARSNDLFYEAVWPRLLERGWRSEKPRSKQCLVFLIPGVKKFSRSKLEKGVHYYDSVTDILSRVAKEPELIELEAEGVDVNKKSDDDDNENDDGNGHLPKKQRPLYLQPKTPNRNVAVLKFTVVDTSLSDGKVRELRTLPSEYSDVFISRACVEFSDDETSEETSDVSNIVPENLRAKTAKSVEKTLPSKKSNDSKKKKKKASKGNNQSKMTAAKSQTSRNRKQGNADVPVVKPQRQVLVHCNQKETSTALENGMPPSCCTSVHDAMGNSSFQAGSYRDKLSSTSSSRGSPDESIENPQNQTMIDLNLPQVPPDAANHDQNSARKSPVTEVRSEPPPPLPQNVNPLRHSTRNRPPTSRALEALADGYLTVNRKRKGKDINSHPSQRARLAVKSNESTNSSMESRIEEADNGASNSSNCNALVGSEVAASQTNDESVSAQCGH